MAAAFANTKRKRRDCNAEFLYHPVTKKITIVVKQDKDIPPNSEIFVYYPCSIWAKDDKLGKEIKIQERKDVRAKLAAKLAARVIAKKNKRAQQARTK